MRRIFEPGLGNGCVLAAKVAGIFVASAALVPSLAMAQSEPVITPKPDGRSGMSISGYRSDQDYKKAQDIYSRAANKVAVERLKASCEKESAIGCALLSEHYRKDQKSADAQTLSTTFADKAWSLARSQCNEKMPATCLSLGEVHLIFRKDPEEAERLFAAGCGVDDGASCASLGTYYSREKKVPKVDRNELHLKAKAAFEKSCDLKSAVGCFYVGQEIYGEAKQLYARSKLKGRGGQPAVPYETVKTAAAAAKVYFEKALALNPDLDSARYALLDIEHQEYFDAIGRTEQL